uniref:ATP synthase subunit a n=1 Tax=Blattabacterium sp. (Euphyllodromia sp.) TaxID=2712805 RepID=A0A6G6BY27_9FLAO|nr:ATP synthase subunit A [Blattabacterium sp. (Euphyllodromia sp.)]
MKVIQLLLCFSCFIILFDNNKNVNNFSIYNTIFDHIKDSHEWNIIENNKNKIYIPLPIILWNNGFEFFNSHIFHNNNIVKGKYGDYKMFNDYIYEINKINDTKEKVIDLSITKNVLAIIISSSLLFFLLFFIKNNYNNFFYPKYKIGILIENIIIFIRNEIAIPYIGKYKYRKFFPFLLTLFFFILINNLMGIIPIFPNITGNINITFVLSIITFFITIINSTNSYWKHILWIPKVPIGIKLLLAPIELIGLLIRPLTLCIRLFANITSGHIVMLSFICIIFILKNIFIAGFSITFGLFISILDIMVSFLQSFIFTTLSALLIGTSVKNYKNH